MSSLLDISNLEVLYIYIITVCYVRVAATNRILLATSLTMLQRTTIETELKLGLEIF